MKSKITLFSLLTALTGCSPVLVRSHSAGPVWTKDPRDIRNYGAICDGRDENEAIQKAIAKGLKEIKIPEGCTWTVPSGVVPNGSGGIHYFGGNNETSVFKSTTGKLLAGSMVEISNFRVGHQVYASDGKACSIAYFANFSTSISDVAPQCRLEP